MNENTRLRDVMLALDQIELEAPQHINTMRDAKRGMFILFANLLRAKVDHLDSLSKFHEDANISKEEQELHASLLGMICNIYQELIAIKEYCPLAEIDNIDKLMDFVKRSIIDPLEAMAKKGH